MCSTGLLYMSTWVAVIRYFTSGIISHKPFDLRIYIDVLPNGLASSGPNLCCLGAITTGTSMLQLQHCHRRILSGKTSDDLLLTTPLFLRVPTPLLLTRMYLALPDPTLQRRRPMSSATPLIIGVQAHLTSLAQDLTVFYVQPLLHFI